MGLLITSSRGRNSNQNEYRSYLDFKTRLKPFCLITFSSIVIIIKTQTARMRDIDSNSQRIDVHNIYIHCQR